MAYVDATHYQHPLDRSLLKSLKSIPGFTPILKAFMKVFSERKWFITTNSSYVELSPSQVPEVYDMLPPICEKLGIAVPHLFLSGSRELNAYTSNDTDPFIVLNAGVIECCSEDVTRAIIAHECGHIASHHVLYRTMGNLILSGAMAVLPGMNNWLVNGAIQAAFASWMRASEYTADRAAALAVGDPQIAVDMCLNLAGGYQGLDLEFNQEAFLEQALAYEQSMNESFMNKAFEVLMYNSIDHPLNAYRALQLKRWCETPEYTDMVNFLEGRGTALPPAVAPTDQALLDDPLAGSLPEAPAQGTARFCSSCGSPLQENARFCGSCGSPVNQ